MRRASLKRVLSRTALAALHLGYIYGVSPGAGCGTAALHRAEYRLGPAIIYDGGRDASAIPGFCEITCTRIFASAKDLRDRRFTS